MDILSILLTVLGLCLFEVISSIDNAIINAEVLSGMSERARKIFLRWGILFAVFIVRGLLPFIILFVVSPGIGISELFISSFTNSEAFAHKIEASSHALLVGGGTFLVFLFFHWLFLERKNYGFIGERFFYSQGIWFYAVVSIILAVMVWYAIKVEDLLAMGAVIGSTAFFVIHGFRQQAEEAEKKLFKSHMSDVSKILYLEIIDSAFSIDGVLGSFAFTLSFPLILLGNGLGAIVLRQLTISNIDKIKQYAYLKNGAMYSVFFLGSIMILDGFGAHIPSWLSPVTTVIIVTYFFFLSKQQIKQG